MKMLSLFFLLLVTPLFAEEVDLSDPFRPVNLVKELPGKAFLIEGLDEVDIKDDRIRRITLGSNSKSINVLFDNKTAKSYSPSLTIWIVDRYGLPIKSCRIQWAFDSVAAGATHSLDETLFPSPPAEVLQFTSVGAPEGAGTPKYLIVQYHDKE